MTLREKRQMEAKLKQAEERLLWTGDPRQMASRNASTKSKTKGKDKGKGRGQGKGKHRGSGKGRSKNSGKVYFNGKGKTSSYSLYPGSASSKVKGKGKGSGCVKCGSMDHWIKDCPEATVHSAQLASASY